MEKSVVNFVDLICFTHSAAVKQFRRNAVTEIIIINFGELVVFGPDAFPKSRALLAGGARFFCFIHFTISFVRSAVCRTLAIIHFGASPLLHPPTHGIILLGGRVAGFPSK